MESGTESLTVAVTGPTGEIGKPFVRALEATPEVGRVLAMARRPFDPAELGWRKTEYRRGDILDRAAVDALVAEADVVVHLAFIVVKASAGSHDINVYGSRNVFAGDGGRRRPAPGLHLVGRRLRLSRRRRGPAPGGHAGARH